MTDNQAGAKQLGLYGNEVMRRNQSKLSRLLKANHPHIFVEPYLPMALGIHREVSDLYGDDFCPQTISRFLSRFAKNHAYLEMIVSVGPTHPRYSLSGAENGAVLDRGIDHALHQLSDHWLLKRRNMDLVLHYRSIKSQRSPSKKQLTQKELEVTRSTAAPA